MVPLQRDITRLVRFGQLSRALDSPNGSSLVSISSRLVSHRKMSRSRSRCLRDDKAVCGTRKAGSHVSNEACMISLLALHTTVLGSNFPRWGKDSWVNHRVVN
ncbi:hypothetical protein CRG98_026577 [Punica granatum]|uniref:Uncharacterized protein n=1 Tax=Punica granatum TaxID=22663 RepID=A0A2I0J9S2_PUNGR|nr:hypothetical protein CRG98_026577 [Punica granatum]